MSLALRFRCSTFTVAVILGLSQSTLAGEWSGAPVEASSSRYGPGAVYARIPEKDEFGRDQLAMFRLWNPDPVALHESNLAALNPVLASIIRKAQADNPELRFVIGSGKRDPALQHKAMAWGWSKTPESPHQSGDAVDLWPLDADGHVHFDPKAQRAVGAAMARAAAALGARLRWGGHFQSFRNGDRSHFELVDP